jgi:hypothetical protein
MVQKEIHTKFAIMSTGGGNKLKYGRNKGSCKIRCTVDVHMILSYSVIDLWRSFNFI